MAHQLRGVAGGTLRVDVVTEGIHSGAASGVVPSSFRIIRQLLDRIEDSATGRVLLESAFVDIPDGRVVEAQQLAADLGVDSMEPFPTVPGLEQMTADPAGALLARTWRAARPVSGGTPRNWSHGWPRHSTPPRTRCSGGTCGCSVRAAPFMGMLGDLFPRAQFVITGVLGPESNVHGPNEFLDLGYAEKLTNCLARVLHAHATVER